MGKLTNVFLIHNPREHILERIDRREGIVSQIYIKVQVQLIHFMFVSLGMSLHLSAVSRDRSDSDVLSNECGF